MEKSLADDIISRLLQVGEHTGEQVQVSESEVFQLCRVSSSMFLMEPSLLELKAPIKIAGDVHGQYTDLLTIFKYGGLPTRSKYLFLGNYVDFGRQSLETILLLLAFKIKYPDRFFLLRGSHECASTNRLFGFHYECERRFNVKSWKVFNDCFNCLPISALINDKILCIHGGLSPDLHNLDQIRRIQRPTSVPASGLLSDLLWSDPSRNIQGWRMIEHCRGYSFGTERVKEFVEKNGLALICRGHQMVKDGFEFFAGQRLVTIISVPNSSIVFDNVGVLMNVDANLKCSFQNLRPVIPSLVLKLATKPRSSSGGDILNRYDEEAPWVKHTERITKSESGSSTSATRPQNSTRVNPSKSTPATKHRSKLPEVKPAERTRKSSSGSKNSATDDNGSSSRANFVANINSTKFRDTSPIAKIAARTSNSSFGSGTGATKSEGSSGANPTRIDPAAKYRSTSPGVKRFLGAKPTERITEPNNIGSNHPTITTTSENSPVVYPSTSKAASKNRSDSPWLMPAERMSKSNTGSSSVTGKPESSQQATRPFKIDPADLYRSTSPGVKRFLGARV